MTCSSVAINDTMRRWLRLALLLVVPLAVAGETAAGDAASTAATAANTGYVAHYELLRDGKKEGIARRSLAPLHDGCWQLQSEIKGTRGMAAFIGFRIEEDSRVRWHHGQLQTEGYRYAQKMAFRKRTRAVVVDHAAGRIIGRDSRDDNKDQTFELRAGVLDRQSVSLALADDLADGATGTLEYAVVGRHEINTWQFVVGEAEPIDTPAGRFDAVVATRIRDDDDGRITRTWFARVPIGTLSAMLPVRIEQSEPGEDDIVMQLSAVTAN